MALKITTEHYNELKTAISAIRVNNLSLYKDQIIAEWSKKDLRKGFCIHKLIRWNVLNHTFKAKWICDNLYPYLNDDHIESALKAIFAELFPTLNLHAPYAK